MIKKALASCSPWLAAFGLVFACWGVADVLTQSPADPPHDDTEYIGSPFTAGQSAVGAPSAGHVKGNECVKACSKGALCGNVGDDDDPEGVVIVPCSTPALITAINSANSSP